MGKNNVSYAEAIAEIERILERFKNDQFDIDTLAGEVKKATELIRFCRDKLRTAEEEVTRILDDGDGMPTD